MIPESTFWAVFPWIAIAALIYIVWWVLHGKD